MYRHSRNAVQTTSSDSQDERTRKRSESRDEDASAPSGLPNARRAVVGIRARRRSTGTRSGGRGRRATRRLRLRLERAEVVRTGLDSVGGEDHARGTVASGVCLLAVHPDRGGL